MRLLLLLLLARSMPLKLFAAAARMFEVSANKLPAKQCICYLICLQSSFPATQYFTQAGLGVLRSILDCELIVSSWLCACAFEPINNTAVINNGPMVKKCNTWARSGCSLLELAARSRAFAILSCRAPHCENDSGKRLLGDILTVAHTPVFIILGV